MDNLYKTLIMEKRKMETLNSLEIFEETETIYQNDFGNNRRSRILGDND